MSTTKFLSLEWFKETTENALTTVIASKLESLMEQDVPQHQQCSAKPEKLYFSMKLVNDTLTVVLMDGIIISKPTTSLHQLPLL